MDQWLEEIRAALPELVVYQQEPMKKHTTFRVGESCGSLRVFKETGTSGNSWPGEKERTCRDRDRKRK